MKKYEFYYSKVSNKICNSATEFKKLLEKEMDKNPEFMLDKLMKDYFGAYWPEFQKFWKQSGETIDWITFALAPHNSIMFVMYVFKEYPEVYKNVKEIFNLK